MSNSLPRYAAALAVAKRELRAARRALARTTKPGAPAVVLPSSWQWAQRLVERRRHSLLRIPGVVGVGLGFKQTNGLDTGQPCVTVFVRRKVPEEALARVGSPAIPRSLREGKRRLPVDVIALGCLRRHTHLTAGTSLGPREYAGRKRQGTLGAYARLPNGNAVGITAMHVTWYREYAWQPGDPIEPMLHPSPLISGAPRRVGRLLRGTRHGIDAATFLTEPPTEPWNVLEGIGPIRGWRPTVYPGDKGTPVRMVGAVSGYRRGILDHPAVILYGRDGEGMGQSEIMIRATADYVGELRWRGGEFTESSRRVHS